VSSVFSTGLWERLDSILFNGAVPDGSFAVRLVWALQWIPTITISATIIAFVTTTMTRRLERLKNGTSPVMESGHVLILGWSNRIFPILQQLAMATGGRRRLVVVVADQSATHMLTEIEARCDDLGKLRVVTRTGDPTNPVALERANLLRASSVIVLEPDQGDSASIATVLAVKSLDPTLKIPVVVEVSDPHHATALRHATGEKVRTVTAWTIIARVTAQACRQHGLATALADFLDFEGNEIHVTPARSLVGGTYRDALVAFDSARVIGIERGETPLLNPALTTPILDGDALIVVSDDVVTESPHRSRSIPTHTPRNRAPWNSSPENLLVIGWSSMGEAVLGELAPFVKSGSTVTVLADAQYVDRRPADTYGGLAVEFVDTKGSTHGLEAALAQRQFDQVLVLAYRHGIDAASADAKTMLILLLINTVLKGLNIRLVAEILDSRRADLALLTEPDDLVVSDRLAAQMMAQLTEDSRLSSIFNDLFDATGVSLNVHPIDLYLETNESRSIFELTLIAAERGESLVGIRRTDGNIHMNPRGSYLYTAAPGDGLIVVSE
jgi:Trk K+ transport system NAD-binding subunit